MNKKLGTIAGVLLSLVVAFGLFAWDWQRRDESSFHRSQVLWERCAESAGPGATTRLGDVPACETHRRAYELGNSARMTSAALTGAAAGAIFALLFFGIRRMVRKSQPAA